MWGVSQELAQSHQAQSTAPSMVQLWEDLYSQCLKKTIEKQRNIATFEIVKLRYLQKISVAMYYD